MESSLSKKNHPWTSCPPFWCSPLEGTSIFKCTSSNWSEVGSAATCQAKSRLPSFCGSLPQKHPICYSRPYKNHESNSVIRNFKRTRNQEFKNLHDIMSFAISNAPACSDKEAEPSVPIHLCDGHFPSNHHGCVGTTIKGFLQVTTSKKQATQHELFQRYGFL